MQSAVLITTSMLSSMLLACAAKAPVERQTRDPAEVVGGTGSLVDGGRPDIVSDPMLPRAGTAAAMTTKPAGAGSTSGGSGADGNAPPMPIVIDQTGSDNPAGLSPAEVTKLTAGGPPADMRWLYPYDGTVFPSGTIAPLVMWTGNPAPDAVYLHMKSQAFEYRGVLKPAIDAALYAPSGSWAAGAVNAQSFGPAQEANKQLAIPQNVWDAAGQRTLGRGDTLRLEVTERVNGKIHGPVVSHITIARGALQGSIYYNTCWTGTSQSSTGVSGVGSMVMRIPAGGNARPVSETTKCIGCHSVSANGSRMVAQRATVAGDLVESLTSGQPVYAWSAQLGSDGTPNASTATHFGTMGSYGALYPDGSRYLAMSGVAGMVWSIGYQVPPLSAATLYDALTGAVIPNTGIPTGASMPMFSPDGTRLVFNDAMLGNGLAVMNYDTRNDKASGYEILLQNDPNSAVRPGWPFFLPDSRAVVFLQTTSPDFASGEGGGVIASQNNMVTKPFAPDARSKAPFPSDLYIADVDTGTVTILARAMGFNTLADANTGTTYLPFGEQDLHRNYFPTVSPVASGGYFWVFFDSMRHFGSMGVMRSLWGAAIDIHADGSYTTDPSHPPFYLPGQEFVSSSHHRAFAALDSCKPDGDKCATGIECCAGACNHLGVCGAPPPNTCAKTDERCMSNADCCPPGTASEPPNVCIAGFCAFVPLL